MPRIALISALLMTVAWWTTAWAQTNTGYPTNWSQPGRGPSTPDGWFPPRGSCYQPILVPIAARNDVRYDRRGGVSARLASLARLSPPSILPPTACWGPTIWTSSINLACACWPGGGSTIVLAIEASFLGLLQWDESRAVRDSTVNSQGTAGNLFSPLTNFGNPPQVGLDFNTLASLRIISQFNNGELNLRQRLNTSPVDHAGLGDLWPSVHERSRAARVPHAVTFAGACRHRQRGQRGGQEQPVRRSARRSSGISRRAAVLA